MKPWAEETSRKVFLSALFPHGPSLSSCKISSQVGVGPYLSVKPVPFTEPEINVCTWLGELHYCSCLTALCGPAWVLIFCKLLFRALQSIALIEGRRKISKKCRDESDSKLLSSLLISNTSMGLNQLPASAFYWLHFLSKSCILTFAKKLVTKPPCRLLSDTSAWKRFPVAYILTYYKIEVTKAKKPLLFIKITQQEFFSKQINHLVYGTHSSHRLSRVQQLSLSLLSDWKIFCQKPWSPLHSSLNPLVFGTATKSVWLAGILSHSS